MRTNRTIDTASARRVLIRGQAYWLAFAGRVRWYQDATGTTEPASWRMWARTAREATGAVVVAR